MSIVADIVEVREQRRFNWRHAAGGLTVAFIVASTLVWGALSLAWPEVPIHVHVRWRADITDDQRVEFERRFGLTQGITTGDTSWEYQLVDTSTANIASLIREPLVDDTAHLNRIRYRPEFAQDRSRQIVAYALATGAASVLATTVAAGMWLVIPFAVRRRTALAVGSGGRTAAALYWAGRQTVVTKVRARWSWPAVVCLIAAACLPIAARVATGPRGALVDVRWAPSVDAATRQSLESRFGLNEGTTLDGATWRYDLIDPSSAIIGELVTHPAVDDTHHIDRVRLALSDAERTSRRSRIASGDAIVAAADGTAVVLALYAGRHVVVALSAAGAALRIWSLLLGYLVRAESRARPYALLLLLGVALYGASLWFPLTNGDDLSYLNAVATVDNPLRYFVGGHGVDNDFYRPLTPVTLWLTYQAFGVWSLPHQLINLLIHFANVFLLYRIVQRIQPDKSLALLLAAVFMVSKYTWGSATFVADRPMVLTGLFVLLFLNYLCQRDWPDLGGRAAPLRISAVIGFSVLALMSKESGIVVPAVAVLYAFFPGRWTPAALRPRLHLAIVAMSLIVFYIGFRVVIFGPNFASYTQDGYMFLGAVRYQHSHDLAPLLQAVNYAENIVKNGIAPLFPIFAEGGALVSQRGLFAHAPVIGATALLFGLALSRGLSRVQSIALMVILANAVAHFALFRFRLHYLSHAAFCIFVAGSPLLGAGPDATGRKTIAKLLTVVALTGSIVWTSYMLDWYRQQRNTALESIRIDGVQRFGPIVEEVLEQYKP